MTPDFFSLTPERILDAVEASLQGEERATGRAQALNSIENRVYEIELEGGASVVAKFYRPLRWTTEQILEEHLFLKKLQDSEVPVVAPLELVADGNHVTEILRGGKTLARDRNGILFAVFPKIRARSFDELDTPKLELLGRFLARLHSVGDSMGAKSSRVELSVDRYGRQSLDFLSKSGFLDSNIGSRYLQFGEDLCREIEPWFRGVKVQRVHGDVHLGNLLWMQNSPIFVDFDDLVIAPPAQDIWMIAGARDEYAKRSRETLLEAYEEMRPFDRSTLSLIEPLRALRMIHYSAWIARRWTDPSFPRMFPQFGSERWWEEEIGALSETLTLCRELSQDY